MPQINSTPVDLFTADQLKNVRAALDAILDLEIATDEERECLMGMDQRIDREISMRQV